MVKSGSQTSQSGAYLVWDLSLQQIHELRKGGSMAWNCNICGRGFPNKSPHYRDGMTYICHDCSPGYFKRINSVPDTESPKGNYGWICPVCGRGNSPYVSSCPCKPPEIVRGRDFNKVKDL